MSKLTDNQNKARGHYIRNHKGELGACCYDCSTVGRIPGENDPDALGKQRVVQANWVNYPVIGWLCSRCVTKRLAG
jgi:hypothetical protein